MGDSRFKWLLAIALALALARFAVVPWVKAQGDERQQLEVLTQRLDRSAGVVSQQKEILAARAKLQAATQQSRKRFPEVADKEHFRLDAQRMLSGIAGRGGARVALFDWVLDGEARQAGLAYGRVNASLEGPLDSLIAVHGQIEGEMPFAAIREIKVDLRQRGAQGLSTDPASMSMVLDLYYRPVAGGQASPPGGGS